MAGVATSGGCEAAIHAVRSYVTNKNVSRSVMVKVDLKNAFNSLERDDLLKAIMKTSPNIYRFMYQCYRTPTTLFFGDYRISELSLLGSPITLNAVERIFNKKN